MKRCLLLVAGISLVCGGARALGQASPLDFQRVAPKLPPRSDRAVTLPSAEDPDIGDDTPVLAELKGIVMLSDASQVRAGGRPGITRVVSEGTGLMTSPELAARLSAFLGKAATFGELQRACAEIVRFYREHNRPVVDAQLPEQDVTSGVVQIVVVEGRVGRIIAEDQRWFTEQRLIAGMRSQRGESIDSRKLLDDINWLNRNSFRHSDLVFREGQSAGETDLVLKTTDRFPFRPYLAYDNWGTDLTGNHRLQTGFNWGNAFGLDQIVSYQFSMAPDPAVFNAHAAVWTIPLPWRHLLEFYGSTARSQPEGLDVDVDAKSLQLGVLYTVPLPTFAGIKHDIALGAELKQSNNNLLFGGTSIFDSDTEIAQARLTYQMRRVDARGATVLQASAFYSPGGITSNNTDTAFQEERAFADANYYYGRLMVQRTQKLPWKVTMVATVAGQLASGNLLASEQFSVGGATTVRGYDEGFLNGDRGWLGSLELHSPPTTVLSRFRLGTLEEELKLLAFFDLGGVSNIDLLPDERQYTEVAAAGVGLRYRLNTWMSVRFDYGWPIRQISGIEKQNDRAFLSVTVSY